MTLILLAVAFPAAAQKPIGIPSVDSAAVARAAYGRAIRADDVAVARGEMAHAAAAWPTQQAYLWGSAIFSARVGDSSAALDALERYAALSLGRDLFGIRDFAFLSASPRFQSLATAHAANRASAAMSHIVRQVGDSTIWPEGADYDPHSKAWYIGSVRHGAVVRVDSMGHQSELWPRDSMRAGAVLGIRVDTVRRTLWITTSGIPQREGFQPADTALAALIAVRLEDGRILNRWDFPVVRGGHTLGDLAIAPNGDVFITDSSHPVLYRLNAARDTISATSSPLFNSLQGLAPTPDGRALYLADYSHGLIHLDLATGTLTRLADAPRSTSLGCDGIAWYHGSLIAVQNGVAPARIVQFYLDPGGLAITRAEVIDRNSAIADEPTIGTIVGDEFVYVANSQWEKHDDSGRRKPGSRVTGPILLGVPLR